MSPLLDLAHDRARDLARSAPRGAVYAVLGAASVVLVAGLVVMIPVGIAHEAIARRDRQRRLDVLQTVRQAARRRRLARQAREISGPWVCVERRTLFVLAEAGEAHHRGDPR